MTVVLLEVILVLLKTRSLNKIHRFAAGPSPLGCRTAVKTLVTRTKVRRKKSYANCMREKSVDYCKARRLERRNAVFKTILLNDSLASQKKEREPP